MSCIFRVCPQGNAMTLHLTGPESHVFPMTFFFNFRILPGPGFWMSHIPIEQFPWTKPYEFLSKNVRRKK